MPLLKRDDGVNFILQPYRESLTIRNTSLLRKEIYYLAEQYGNYVRLFKRKSGEYEAAFSQEPGILLGEIIWDYFDRPDELIYCEKLDSKEPQVLLVIVREGKVYLDAKVTPEALFDEIVSLLVEISGRYVVYTYGDFPEVFDHPAIKSHTQLQTPVFPSLSVEAAFQLWSLEQALDEQGLARKHRSSLIALTVVCLGVLGGLWWFVHSKEKATIYINPYEQYERALQSPSPTQQINALIAGLQKVDSLTGWYSDQVTYNGQSATMPLHSLGGTASQLMTQSRALNLNVRFTSDGATVNFPTTVGGRTAPDKIANSQQTLVLIIDRMMQLLPGKSVQINNVSQNPVFSETRVTISFNNLSPEILQLIVSKLDDLPVSLVSLTASKNGGLFTGNLQVNVVGN